VLGTDALRYFLMREVVFGQDGSFSYDALVGRYNADLANGLGNLASRTLTMINQYRDGKIPSSNGDQQIAHAMTESAALALGAFERFDFSKALEVIWNMIGVVDKYIVERAPWKLARAGEDESKLLDETLYTTAEALRIITALLIPVIPESAAKIWSQLGCKHSTDDVRTAELNWGHCQPGQALGSVVGVFPRADAKAAIEKMTALEKEELARQHALLGKTKPPEAKSPETKITVDGSSQITIDDFSRVDLRVGIVKSAEPIKGADKLLHLHVDIGEPQPRSIVAGIAVSYKPEELIGRKVVIVANLAPRKLRGVESQGMIVAASREGDIPVLASFLEDVPIGARLK
jgi:methionyl-tRNA synthetase